MFYHEVCVVWFGQMLLVFKTNFQFVPQVVYKVLNMTACLRNDATPLLTLRYLTPSLLLGSTSLTTGTPLQKHTRRFVVFAFI